VKHPDERLRSYCRLLAAAPVSVTSIRDPARLWAVHVDDALTAIPILERLAPEAIVDVGSGGGSPGLPLALATGWRVTLLEATGAKCDFLRAAAAALEAPCGVIHARSEDHARAAGRDAYDLALARSLAAPPVAAELCLPLVRPGGHVLLWTAATDAEAVAAAAGEVAGGLVEVVATGENRRLLLLRKTGPTPTRFPRRPGMASKRPLVRVPSRA
jgi:16S rRNA (guanine527-N7)-methyltransferase